MRLMNWWKRWKRGDAVCKVASAEALNRVYNILEDLEAQGLNGIDAQLDKPTDADGKGWTLTIDGNWLYERIIKPGQDGIPANSVTLVLSGSGATANQQKWEYGDKNARGKLYIPIVHPYRLYWDSAYHQLLYFEREMWFTPSGLLYKVSAESSPQAVFTSVPENF